MRRRLGPLLEDLQLRTRTLPLRFDSPAAAFDALPSTCNGAAPAVEIDARYLVSIGRRKLQRLD